MNELYHIDYNFKIDIDNDDDDITPEYIFANIFSEDLESNDKPLLIGKMKLCLFNIHKLDLEEAFDHTASSDRIGSALIDYDEYEFNQELLDKVDSPDDWLLDSILVIDTMVIKDTHRNKGLGKKILKSIENTFNGKCSYIALQSHPLQLCDISRENYTEFGLDKISKKDSFKKLNKFYSDCGFIEIPDSEYSYFIKNMNLN
jgi:GNAT superfamily N-acetyltransferase